MNVPKATPEVLGCFAAAVPDAPDVEQKKVFGFPACFVNGNMFMGVHGEEMILRLGEEKRRQFLADERGLIFEPMPGRPMREYAVVPRALRADMAKLDSWVAESLAYVRAMPPKEKKAKASRK
ncbi:MAG TPA: TfoX/Sxy family protein [Chthonomonadaceae bacterium]|nr:TfoX/Sxy family protein [Chthonomonadaceae bacterium]